MVFNNKLFPTFGLEMIRVGEWKKSIITNLNDNVEKQEKVIDNKLKSLNLEDNNIEFFKNHYFESKKKGQINPALFNFISNYLAGGT